MEGEAFDAIYDEERLAGEPLTPEEIEDLRREFAVAAIIVRRHFKLNSLRTAP